MPAEACISVRIISTHRNYSIFVMLSIPLSLGVKSKVFRSLFFLQLVFVAQNNFAQNLVPNPSFEDTIVCPSANGQLKYACAGWSTIINSPDYFNVCCVISNQVSIPQNGWGYQNPYLATDGAYAGFYAYISFFPGSEEFLGRSLLSPLIIGQRYFVSMKINFFDGNFSRCAMNKIGIKFTNVNFEDTVSEIPSWLKNNTCHVFSDSIISDTLNWTNIKGSFIADSSYKYLLIGQFFDTLHIQIQCFDTTLSSGKYSYYYVDQICVSTDSLECDQPININQSRIFQNTKITIYPNPFSNESNLILPAECENEDIEILIFDQSGRSLFSNDLTYYAPLILKGNFLENGMYFIEIHVLQKYYFGKLLITK